MRIPITTLPCGASPSPHRHRIGRPRGGCRLAFHPLQASPRAVSRALVRRFQHSDDLFYPGKEGSSGPYNLPTSGLTAIAPLRNPPGKNEGPRFSRPPTDDLGGSTMPAVDYLTRTKRMTVALIAGVALLLGALAATPAADAAIVYVCQKHHGGTVRFVAKQAKCKRGEVKRALNTKGTKGNNGSTGSSGSSGSGVTGATGPVGAEGRQG